MLALLVLAAPAPAAARQADERYAAAGPWEVEQTTTGPCDRKRDLCDVFYPRNLGRDGARHALIAWGNGTDKTPSPSDKYAFLLRHLASWGFVVVASRDGSAGSGETILDAVDHMRRADSDPGGPFHGKLDLTRIGVAGHSQGASGAANAMLASGGAVGTALLLHIPQQAFCSAPQTCLAAPALSTARSGSFFYVSGTRDFVISPDRQWGGSRLNSLATYYGATPEALPKVKAVIVGADHNDVTGRPSCPPRMMGCKQGAAAYLSYPTAWLMWRLWDDPAGPSIFGQGGALASDARWKSVTTNVR